MDAVPGALPSVTGNRGARPASRPPCRRHRQGERRDRVEFRAPARAGNLTGFFKKTGVCIENLSPGVVVMKSAQDGA
jgi:hypothetical protein